MLNEVVYPSARHIRAFTHSEATAGDNNHIKACVSFKGLLVHECNEHFNAEVDDYGNNPPWDIGFFLTEPFRPLFKEFFGISFVEVEFGGTGLC